MNLVDGKKAKEKSFAFLFMWKINCNFVSREKLHFVVRFGFGASWFSGSGLRSKSAEFVERAAQVADD